MKAKQRLMINYFLSMLSLSMNSNDRETSSFWEKIYSRDELKNILGWFYFGNIPQDIDLDKMSDEELLFEIGNHYHMLCYFIEQQQEELGKFYKPTSESVKNTLDQLDLSNHILMQKPIDSWSETDMRIYRSLYKKAGNPIPYFGIYKITLGEGNQIVFNLIDEIYDTHEDALKAFSRIVTQGKYLQDELKIVVM